MDIVHPSDLADHQSEGYSASELLRAVRARLAEIDAAPMQELVVGVWRPREGLLMVALAGEMDMSNAAQFTSEVDRRLGPVPYQLVVELSRLTFIDSSGINQLVKVAKAVEASGGSFLLAGPTAAAVTRVFEIVKLSEFIAMAETLEDALARVGDTDVQVGFGAA